MNSQTNDYLKSSAETWGINLEKAHEIFDFLWGLLNTKKMTIGEMAQLANKTFKKRKEKNFALFELGKLIGHFSCIKQVSPVIALASSLKKELIH